jgi:hypothetical protein
MRSACYIPTPTHNLIAQALNEYLVDRQQDHPVANWDIPLSCGGSKAAGIVRGGSSA